MREHPSEVLLAPAGTAETSSVPSKRNATRQAVNATREAINAWTALEAHWWYDAVLSSHW